MSPERLIRLGAGLQRLADKFALWDAEKTYTDANGQRWEMTLAGWQAVIS